MELFSAFLWHCWTITFRYSSILDTSQAHLYNTILIIYCDNKNGAKNKLTPQFSEPFHSQCCAAFCCLVPILSEVPHMVQFSIFNLVLVVVVTSEMVPHVVRRPVLLCAWKTTDKPEVKYGYREAIVISSDPILCRVHANAGPTFKVHPCERNVQYYLIVNCLFAFHQYLGHLPPELLYNSEHILWAQIIGCENIPKSNQNSNFSSSFSKI